MMLKVPYDPSILSSMSHERQKLTRAHRIVVKLGSGVLSRRSGGLDSQRITHLAAQVAAVQRLKKQVVLVSSGAIAAGMARLKLRMRPTQIADLQACAAIGQSLLMACYDRAFGRQRLTVGQILLTHEDFRHARRRHNARQTILNLLKQGVVPVINENDAVSFDEIKFGDNDQLAAMVHELVGADACIILSNVDGFMIRDSARSTPRLVSTIQKITPQITRQAGGSNSQRSVGGMRSKLLAARRVLRTRSPLIVANGSIRHILSHLLQGKLLGSIFLP